MIFIPGILLCSRFIEVIHCLKITRIACKEQVSANPVFISGVIIRVDNNRNPVFIIFKMFPFKTVIKSKAALFCAHPIKIGNTGLHRFFICRLRTERDQAAFRICGGILLVVPDILQRRDCHKISIRVVLSQCGQCIA